MTKDSLTEGASHLSLPLSRRTAVGRIAGAGVAAALTRAVGNGEAEATGLLPSTPSGPTTLRKELMSTPATATDSPVTIVLVHGAFADASTWSGVSERLLPAGHHVIATANPLRGLAPDSAYLESLLNQISGPVLLVGHSYAGCVIGEAAARVKNVVGLVFVSAVMLDEGESQMSLLGQYPKSAPLFGPSLRNMTYPLPDGKDGEESIVDPAMFPEIFCADLDPATQVALAVSQRPLSSLAATEKATAAAWKDLPTWAVFGTADMCLGPEALGAMAKRAKAPITELQGGSHLALLSQPAAVTDVILTALKAV
jgi:pimeloyl-ACP methyl ester carboxylesterase